MIMIYDLFAVLICIFVDVYKLTEYIQPPCFAGRFLFILAFSVILLYNDNNSDIICYQR